MRRLVLARRLVLLVAVSAGLPGASRAQGATPYLPLDDVSYGYIDALQSRGFLPGLSVLERPYTVGDVRKAMARSDTNALSPVLRGWTRRLSRAMAKYDDGRGAWDRRGRDAEASADSVAVTDRSALTLHVNAGIMGTVQTSGIRELMLSDSISGVYPGVQIRAFASYGNVVSAFRFNGDQRVIDDIEYAGFEGRLPGAQAGGPRLAGRAEEGYLSAQFPLAEIFIGRMARNWGPPAYDGMLLGHATWSYDQIGARLGNRTFHLAWLASRLSDHQDTTRYLTVRRAAANWWGVEFGLSESVVYSGVGRNFEWSSANPLVPALDGMYNSNEQSNLNLAADWAVPTSKGLFSGQVFIDDLQFDGTTPKPPMYGFSLTADGLRLAGDHRWYARYTEISNLVYRNLQRGDNYEQQYVSLGRGFTDYREVRVGADLAVRDEGTLRPYLAVRWQGAGTYRNPFPPEAQWAATPTILQGPVMSVWRLALESHLTSLTGVEITTDVGINRVRNDNHIVGMRRTALEGRVRVQLEPGWLARRVVLRAD